MPILTQILPGEAISILTLGEGPVFCFWRSDFGCGS